MLLSKLNDHTAGRTLAACAWAAAPSGLVAACGKVAAAGVCRLSGLTLSTLTVLSAWPFNSVLAASLPTQSFNADGSRV
jgi:hypothetical protein